ncbi:MAG: TerB N-terminal domain-containing protein [Oscillospiraceae bacterium]|nr:TerB N-terminal domain-containing protein [Oscillospiraceae bacterium]
MNKLFYEIEYDSNPFPNCEPIPGVGKFVLKSPESQAITAPENDPIRERFYAMRELANELKFRNRPSFDFGGLYKTTHNRGNLDGEMFYKQGMFMADFEDDYCEYKDFTQYYPTYQMMGYEQLRTYFTWRTAVRNGDIRETSLSYAFVYIYELLNNIGVENPQEGLDKLTVFLQAFRKFGEFGDTLDKYMKKWLADYHEYYNLPQESHRDSLCDSADLNDWHSVSAYDIKKSRFYADNAELINEVFPRVIPKLALKDLVFQPIDFERNAFNGAVFFNRKHKTIKMTRLFPTDSGRRLIGDVIKKIELCLRERRGFKYKIKANPTPFDSTIEQTIAEYFAELNRIEVAVDFGNLKQIRKEALETQEKLIVPEYVGDALARPAEPIPEPPTKNAFIAIELKALALLLNGESLKAFADESGVMLEVLVDSLNEKALDLIGDNVIDDEFVLYDDYAEQVKEWL